MTNALSHEGLSPWQGPTSILTGQPSNGSDRICGWPNGIGKYPYLHQQERERDKQDEHFNILNLPYMKTPENAKYTLSLAINLQNYSSPETSS